MCKYTRGLIAKPVLCLAIAFPLLAPALIRAAETVGFEQVGKILTRRCLECHNDRQTLGELSLTTLANALEGGDSGPALAPGSVEQSLLLERIEGAEMPPEVKGQPQPLPKEEVALLRSWIEQGAPWPQSIVLDPYALTTESRGGRNWWSFQTVVRPVVPQPALAARVVNPIDAFILAKLEQNGFEPAPPARRRTMIRRLYFDVLGLPPTAEEINAFLADASPHAYEKLVDRLLASPHFGERWGRYWLDLARFAETSGYERDQPKPNIWKYRDWVIRAINEDKPFDRFLIEQIAGDELPDRDEQTVIATGFLRLGSWNDEPNDQHEYKYERLEDMIHATFTATVALTVKCARCHDHKFDPIPQVDYYRVGNAFWAGFLEPGTGKLLGGPDKTQLGYDVFGWTDRAGETPLLHVLRSGNPKQPGPVAQPGQLSLATQLDANVAPPPADAATTQRRWQLARWITAAKNPLTARVAVNRLWGHHFGAALVRTPNNFGFKGERPTHPELLDWLAAELVTPSLPPAGPAWSLKRLHKMLLMCSTYRQSSNHPRHEEYAQRDFSNHYWWRAERRRLDAEALRDAMLSAAVHLDLRLGGPSFKPTIHPEALEGLSRKSSAWTASSPEEQLRRSVYIYTQRSLPVPLMTAFDFADTTLPCGRRDVTTVAPQALALLNNRFVHLQSETLAQRVANTAPGKRQRIETAWSMALGRLPSAVEIQIAESHLARQQARFTAALAGRQPSTPADTPAALPELPGLALRLRADSGVETDAQGRVVVWRNAAGAESARQDQAARRPMLVEKAAGGQPALRFDGQGKFLHVAAQVLSSQQFSIFAIATDNGSSGHREIFSNWNGAAGNSVNSVFLGLTSEATVRFSDTFAPAGNIKNRRKPFMLTSVSGASDAVVFQGARELSRKSAPLPTRTLETAYVIGQQGNINGEYWHGDISELIVYDRELSSEERGRVWAYLARRYDLPATQDAEEEKSAQRLALESLCHVLLNSNEFIYVD